MTTYLIFSDPNDGHLLSRDVAYAKARTNTGATKEVVAAGQYLHTGQNTSGGMWWVYESFLSFDTSVINTAEEIIDAHIRVYSGWTINQNSTVWNQNFYLKNWTAPLTTAQWQNPAAPGTLLASFGYAKAAVPFATRFTGGDGLVANISKTAPTKMVSISDQTVNGWATAPTEIWMESANSVNKPALVVYTTALTTMNAVENTAHTLTDGTTVSIRSNGAASPTLTLGYQPINGAFTSLGTLNAAFHKAIDSPSSLSITSDPQGNFYIVGVSTDGLSVVAQAYVRSAPTVWAAKTPLRETPPAGNKQSIRSVSATWMGRGTTNDHYFIRVIIARGAGGNVATVSNHISGMAWTQDIALNPANLRNGTGKLLNTAADSLWGYLNAHMTGIPAYVDSVPMTPNLTAIYVQRGKFANQTVGGVYTMSSINSGATAIYSSNLPWVNTGSSKLIPINGDKFAHVYDEDGRLLKTTFFNARAQVLGSASIAAESFYLGEIGRAWTAHYDETSNLVRVFYINSTGAGRALNRVDISPNTFSAQMTANVTTALGAASSVNTVLRASDNADERRVAIDASNLAGTTLSTQVYYSTAGNIVPSVPSITTRTAFDAVKEPADFSWTFSDRNPKDVQTAYQVEISRADTAAIAKDTGKVTSSATTYSMPANTLVNDVDYRWRVRLYDTIGGVGTWSAYQNFSTSTTGSITITAPATDNLEGIETSSYTIAWTYSGAQKNRQVKVYQTSGNVLVSDTGMQASTAQTYVVSNLASETEYRIEVSLINTAGVTVPAVSRLITPNYSSPMVPTLEATVNDTFVEVRVANPVPTGSRPEVVFNDIYRRENGPLSTEEDYIRIGTTNNNGIFRDYSVKSDKTYDYRVIGRDN